MREHWDGFMKVGIVHFMAFPETMSGESGLIESVQRIVEDEFFSAIEVGIIKDPKVRRNVSETLHSAHLTVGFGAQPYLLRGGHNLNSFNESERKKAIEVVKGAIDEAYELGAERLAFLSGAYPGEDKKAEAIAALVDSLDEICEYAESQGDLGITLETFDQKIDKKALIGPVEDAAAVAERVREKHKGFGIMYDLSHAPLLDEEPQKALNVIKKHLVHVHIGNCVKKDPSVAEYGDKHPRFGYPGGENDTPQVVAFLKALFDVGYLGSGKRPIVAFEVKPQANEGSETVIANAKRTLREAWFSL